MATKLLNFHQQLLQYKKRNFRSLLYFLRYFSDHKRNLSEATFEQQNPSSVNTDVELESKWLNIRAGIFGPDDKRLPYPGNVGFGYDHRNFLLEKEAYSIYCTGKRTTSKTDIKFQTNKEQFLMDILEARNYLRMTAAVNSQVKIIDEDIQLECKVQKCPQLLKKDFSLLFPDENLSGELTVITLCQRTQNDMSGWSEEVEEEREKLINEFSVRAESICNFLMENGFWADYIDPCSGRPVLGSFTNSTLFETDERYRYLGFKIEDLGCCKVISHGAWGTRIFVGAICCNAPVSSERLAEALIALDIQKT